MFNQSCRRSFIPAWAGAEAGERPGDRFLMSGPGRGKGHGRGHGGRSEDDWGDRPRTRRGDIKFLLLEVLSQRPQHGYELIKELEARRAGFRRPSPGSVYPTLQMLEEGDYLTSEEIEGKRVYTITESGRQLLSDRKVHHPSPTDDSLMETKPSLIELRRALTEVNDAVTQVARSGSLEQAHRVREMLAQLKREVYKLLSEE